MLSEATPLTRVWTASVFMAIVLGLAFRVVLAVLTPVGSASIPGVLSSYNDELAHANYVMHIVEHGSLPGQVESIQGEGALTRGRYENYQPPLYYLLVAGISEVTGVHDLSGIVFIGRFLGIILCAGIGIVYLRIARALNLDGQIASAGLIFIALSGVFVCFTSTLSNEPLFWLLAGGMIHVSFRIHQEGLRATHWMVFAAVACLALYTKLTAILLLPLPLLTLRKRNARLLVAFAGMYCLILVCAFPLFLRNAYTFGSLLPLNAGFGEPLGRFPDANTAVYGIRSFIFPWAEFWHGWLGLMFLLPFCVYCLWVFARRNGWQILSSQPVLLIAMIIAFASYLWLNTRYDQAEGRYLFSSWPALPILLIGSPRSTNSLWLLVAVMLLPFSLFILPLAGV
jgi:hypothetical protein